MALGNETLTKLREIVGPQNVLTGKEDLIPYSFDGTAALRQMPGCVAFASTTAQVADIVKFANQARVPVVTRGSGTGLSGGSLPVGDCIVLCLVKMDKVLELDRANLTMLVEAGVTTLTISDAAAAAGLFYPPDPGSMKISTIGGNVAENSGGLRGLKYGITRNYVMGLEVVLGETSMQDKRLEGVAGELLRAQGLTLSVAESCTGGLLGHRLTNIPRSSDYFSAGVVAYSYETKERILNVRHNTLYDYGAVSERTGLEMARGARRLFGSDIALSITGIAGPGGGMPGKPVGLTYIALSARDKDICRRFVWDSDRDGNKNQSAEAALEMLVEYLRERAAG